MKHMLWYSLELPQWDKFNEYLYDMFLWSIVEKKEQRTFKLELS